MVMTGAGAVFFLMLGSLLLGLAFVVGWVLLKVLQVVLWVVVGVGRGVGWGLRGAGKAVAAVVLHLSRFARGELIDGLHTAGALLTAAVISPLALLNLAMGRWTAARHYGTAIEDELVSAARSFYRVVLGNPIRLVGLAVVTEGLERRLPGVIDRAPREAAHATSASFAGYKIVGTLPGGGSGAKLYVARPMLEKLSELSGRGHADPGKVVIKSFALEEGSTLPEIVRETRALEAASRLGLVLEHELSPRRFHYVMPYVPGDDLGRVTSRMHAHATAQGLDRRELALAMGYAADVLRSLHRFHTSGLWHKDIKPTNLIVSDGRVHVVDLGLVTPLQSALTLTTHGTEYYRDPEMVRLALKGVKVHEVDGVKFDLYSAGAVLYSMIENSFPAHGSLSSLTKRCPEGLSWIVRRAMADLSTRYGSAREMLVDLETLIDAKDPFAVLPADLPSVQGSLGQEPFAAGAAAPAPVFAPSFGTAACAEDIAAHPVERARSRRRSRKVAAAMLLMVGTVAAVRAVRERHVHMDRAASAWSELRYAASSSPVYPSPHARRAGIAPMFGDPGPVAIEARAEDSAERASELASQWADSFSTVLKSPARAPHAGSVARALVLETPAGLLDVEHRRALELELAENGYQVLDTGDAAAEETDDTIAEALHAIGLGDPTDPETVGRLQEWLDRNADLEIVVWVGRVSESNDVVRVLERRDPARGSGWFLELPDSASCTERR